MMKTANRNLQSVGTLVGVLILSSGLSCAVAPSGSGETAPAQSTAKNTRSDALSTAYNHYERRDFGAAASAYDALSANPSAAADTRRQALLGSALVYLSTDPEWRNLQKAGAMLQAAESMDGASVEAGMLMNALSALIGVENNISELNKKLSNSNYEVARLKEERTVLQEEQAALNEALEKLKELTIGN